MSGGKSGPKAEREQTAPRRSEETLPYTLLVRKSSNNVFQKKVFNFLCRVIKGVKFELKSRRNFPMMSQTRKSAEIIITTDTAESAADLDETVIRIQENPDNDSNDQDNEDNHHYHRPFINHSSTIHQPFINHSSTIHRPLINH